MIKVKQKRQQSTDKVYWIAASQRLVPLCFKTGTLLAMTAIFFFMISLQSCVNVAMTGAQVVYDRHNLQKKLTDQYISLRANRDVNGDRKRFGDTNIAIAVFNRIVL